MANELRAASTTGTLYARIMNPSGLWWNGTTFEAYAAANYANYDVAMTEQGNSGVYVADFPSAITSGGTYQFFVHRQAGASPAEGDVIVTIGHIDWTGSSAISAGTGAMTATDWRTYLLGTKGFKRTDKDTEIYAATTDAIQQLRRRFGFDEAEADAETTDQISTLGDFRLTVETDMGLLVGVIVEDGENADPLTKLSKKQFDALYPDIHVTSNRGYPLNFCVFAGSVYIGPQPDSVDYNYRLSYSKRAGTITSSTSGVPFTDLYRDVLAEFTLAILWYGLDEYEKSDSHEGRGERLLEPAIRRERKNAGLGTFQMRTADF